MAEIGRMADAFIAGAKDNVLPREEVINTFKMVQVIRKNMEDEDCNAFVAPVPMPAPPVDSTRSGAPCV